MKLSRFAILILLVAVINTHAFVLKFDDSGYIRRWNLLIPNPAVSTNVVNPNTHAVRYFLASDAWSTTNTAAELNAVRAAFAQWQSVTATYLKFEDGGLVNPPVDVNTDDNKNVVFWAKGSTFVNGGHDNIAGSLAVTFTEPAPSDNSALESDIVLNGVEFGWYTDFFTKTNTDYFVEAVALHEIGHLIGLNHSPAGGPTMFRASDRGMSVQTGLSADDISAVRHLYPASQGSFGAIKGTVTKSGNPVFGAGVYIQDAASNVVAGTVTESDGKYLAGALPVGNYSVWAAPLDDAAATVALCRGSGIASTYSGADTTFLPTTNFPVTVTAGATNTVNISLVGAAPAFRITRIRQPRSSSGLYSAASLPASMSVGQSGYFIGVVSANLPTNSASLTITGDGLTLGPTIFNTTILPGNVIMSVSISVSPNATPGLRNFIVQQGTNIAMANGFLEIMPASMDYNFDGLDDNFQRTYFPLFTSSQAGPLIDGDTDGMNNSQEFVAGTSPTNSFSLLKMLPTTVSFDGPVVSWQSIAGKQYQVSTRTNVISGFWQNIGSPITADGPITQFLDTTATNGVRFYRVQVLP